MRAVAGRPSPEARARDMAVVVLSLACEPGLVPAVRSVLAQDPPPAEVVVVNSGGGDPAAVLRAADLDDVPVIHREERLFAGAARNLGIAATSAPIAAFLAADCIAAPGWVAGRLRAHEDGADAVASMLVNAYPENRSAAAAALLLHHRRMPHAPEPSRLAFGLSFDRRLLEALGPFREDLRTGEDGEFKRRMNGASIAQPATVVTAHRYPREPTVLLREQFHRGRRQMRARHVLGVETLAGRFALSMISDAGRALLRTGHIQDVAERRRVRHGWPLIPFAALAYASGVMAEAAAVRRREGRPR